MKAIIFEYIQNKKRFFSAILDSKFINDHSKVLIYGETDRGYQRKIKEEHVQGIKKYIAENDSFLFPTSIILAIDSIDYEKCEKERIREEVYEIDLEKANFRIVDGQHRLRALLEAKKDISLNVVVMIINMGEEKLELDVFTTINSKAKRIQTDLAELAKYKYQILSKKDRFNENDSIDYISMKTATDLNEHSQIWRNSIKVDVNGETNNGIVGISAYKKSITNLVKKVKKNMEANSEIKKLDDPIKKLDKISSECYKILEEAWKICFEKWYFCFNPENKTEPYNTKFYIQKTLGVSVINGLISDFLDNDNSTEMFKLMIQNSNVNIADWETGGSMSGYSSESGFSKIRKFITGEMNIRK